MEVTRLDRLRCVLRKYDKRRDRAYGARVDIRAETDCNASKAIDDRNDGLATSRCVIEKPKQSIEQR